MTTRITLPQSIDRNRDNYVDMAKAIAILLMVIGHNEFAYWFGGIPRSVIFSFHMPLFFIFSGYMHKQKNIAVTLRNSAKSLLYPYLTFGVASLLIKILLRDYPISLAPKVLISVNSAHANSVWFAEGVTIGPIWFLVALFWGKVVFTFLADRMEKWRLLVVCLIISYSAVWLGWHFNLPFGILTGLSSLVFIALGYYIKNNGMSIFFLTVCIIIWPFALISPLDMAGLYYDNYPISVIGAIGGTAVCFIISMMLTKIPYIRDFSFFGKYSLHVLCWHYIIMAFFPYEVVTGKLYCTLFVISPFIISYFTAKYDLFAFMFRPVGMTSANKLFTK